MGAPTSFAPSFLGRLSSAPSGVAPTVAAIKRSQGARDTSSVPVLVNKRFSSCEGGEAINIPL